MTQHPEVKTAVAAPKYLRLRQICLVAQDLDAVVKQLCTTFGVAVCHRDPNVGKYGLHNALMPFGNTFVEVVSPLPGKAPDETAGGRYMQRIGGDCGYMVIMDQDDVKPFREHVAAIGVRIANKLDYPGYQGTQLHPKDVGGTIMSIGHDAHGEDIWASWHAAGPAWKDHVHTERVAVIAGVETQSDEPNKLAERWAEVLGKPVHDDVSGLHVHVDNAKYYFVKPRDGRGETMSGLDIKVNDRAAILAGAKQAGLETDGDVVKLCGVRWRLLD